MAVNEMIVQYKKNYINLLMKYISKTDCRSRDRMVIGFTTTDAINDYHH